MLAGLSVPAFYLTDKKMTEQHIHIILRHTDGGKWLAYTQGEKYRGKYHKDPTTAIVKAILRGRIKI